MTQNLGVEIKISSLMEQLFIIRDDVYAEAYLKDPKRMGYAKKDGLIDKNLILSHINQEITIGVYQLNSKKVKWGCLDFDLDTEEDFENAKKLYNELKKRNLHPLIERSGGGTYKVHIWIFSDCEAVDMYNFLYDICEETKLKPHEIFPKQTDISKDAYGNLVKLPLALHLVSKKNSTLLDDDFNDIIILEDIESKLKYHLENKDTIPKTIKEKPLNSKNSTLSANKFDDFFNKVLYTELPPGISKEIIIGTREAGVNNNILKNEAIWFYKKGFSLEKLTQDIKPIFKKNKWSFEDLKGWFMKAQKEDIKDISLGELYEFSKAYYPELIQLLPQEKEDSGSFDVYTDEDLMNYSPPPENWLIKNQIPKGEIGLIVGKREDRKTFTALFQAICLSEGINCLDDEIKEKKRILFVDVENGKDEIKKRTYILKKALGIENKPLSITYLDLPYLKLDKIPFDEYTDEEAGNNFYKFKNLVESFKPDLIIVDCLARIVSFNVDKDNQEISNFFSGVIRQFTKKYGCSWLFIHHLRKTQNNNNKPSDEMDEIRGGSELVNYCRFILSCSKPKYQNDSERELIIFKVLKMSNSIKPPAKVISFSSENGGLKVSYEGEPEEILSGEVQCANAIKQWLIDKGIRSEFKTKIILDASNNGEINFKRTIINGGLSCLIQQGFILRKKRGVYDFPENNLQQKLNKK